MVARHADTRLLVYSSFIAPTAVCHSSPFSHSILNLGQVATNKDEKEPAMSTTAHKVAAQAAARTKKTAGTRRPPSVLREIVYGMSLGVFAGYLWKLHHWSNQRRTREFYSLLDQGKITVVADEPSTGAGD